jgi:NADP-dependent 3-hydroxy acid dehydrogenase YdfG
MSQVADDTTPTAPATSPAPSTGAPIPLRGKVAIVTGASSGLGAAIATALVTHGVHVALAGRRADQLDALARRLASIADGGETLLVPGDVRDPAQVERLFQHTLERWGGLDIVIANAGLGYRAPIAEGDPARWKDLLDTNVFGLLLTLRFGVPPLLARGGGHVIVLSSVAARVTQAGNGVYSATKVAVNAIAEALRQEVTRQGVRVTSIEPGVVQTAFQEVAGYSADLRRRLLEEQTPLTAADIGAAVLYALEQPPHVSINELLIRPTDQVSA